ncbi:MAG: hypothetical protein ABIH46_10450 [Chloroflexota bacterium]
MALTRTYYYVGAVKTEQPQVKKHVLRGTYAVETEDDYSQTTRCTLTFARISNITDVIGLYGDVVDNVGLVPVLVSISTNVLTFALLESGPDAQGPLREKAGEAYDKAFTFYAVVAGI